MNLELVLIFSYLKQGMHMLIHLHLQRIKHLNLIGVWFGENQRTNPIKYMFGSLGWTLPSNLVNYSTLINEKTWGHVYSVTEEFK